MEAWIMGNGWAVSTLIYYGDMVNVFISTEEAKALRM